MTRNGKIARLPRNIREDINRRLDDAEQANTILPWLNGLKEVTELLSREFDGRPINAQNLSDWKQGGFREWQRHREVADRLASLVERSQDLARGPADQPIPEILAGILAAELAAHTLQLLEDATDPSERWVRLRQALRQLHLLRRADSRAARTRIEEARWQIECEEREKEKQAQAVSDAYDEVMQPLRQASMRPVLVAAYGGGPDGEKAADFILQMQREYGVKELPPPDSKPPPQSRSIKPNQGQSR